MSENLESAVNDRSRHITIRGQEAIVPLKFDQDGNLATVDKLIFKRLSLDDLRFLKTWREADWNLETAVARCQIAPERVERLVKKLQCFRDEDAKVRALCAIPTPAWISAQHVENIYSGGTLADSQHKSLVELAKIEAAYKQQSPNTQINVFNLPKLSPEVEQKFKQLAEEAIDADTETA